MLAMLALFVVACCILLCLVSTAWELYAALRGAYLSFRPIARTTWRYHFYSRWWRIPSVRLAARDFVFTLAGAVLLGWIIAAVR